MGRCPKRVTIANFRSSWESVTCKSRRWLSRWSCLRRTLTSLTSKTLTHRDFWTRWKPRTLPAKTSFWRDKRLSWQMHWPWSNLILMTWSRTWRWQCRASPTATTINSRVLSFPTCLKTWVRRMWRVEDSWTNFKSEKPYASVSGISSCKKTWTCKTRSTVTTCSSRELESNIRQLSSRTKENSLNQTRDLPGSRTRKTRELLLSS